MINLFAVAFAGGMLFIEAHHGNRACWEFADVAIMSANLVIYMWLKGRRA